MVSALSLHLFAGGLLLVALAMGRWSGAPVRDRLADGSVAVVGAVLPLATAVALLAALHGVWESPWRLAPTLLLLSSPLAAALALRMRGTRSLARALLGSTLAFSGVLLWLTLNLRGPLGGWSFLDVVLVLPASAIAIGSGACLGGWSKRAPSVVGLALVLLCLPLLLTGAGCDGGSARADAVGTLEVAIRDAATLVPIPARVELLDESGHAIVPGDALRVFSDCGNVPLQVWVPELASLQAIWNGRREVANPYTGTTQFYVDGSFRVQVPPGRYALRATRGMEYETANASATVEAGQVTDLQLDLERWIDLAQEGWYGADDHLHIPRPHAGFDSGLATWMEAEGLHVANLLQMGLARDVHVTPQRSFGPGSVFQRRDTLLMSGQENPRTHVLGHSIVLGADRFIDRPRQYLLYDEVWAEARQLGAINGYAHWALAGAEEGLALWGHEASLDFVEVLNLGFAYYDRWYEALDLGLRIGPTAGTDYPCLPSLPGRERFYARVDGPLRAETWLEAVRRGRTFVTNGPAIELTVSPTQEGAQPQQAGPGEELLLPGPGEVRVRGRLRFDPERDAMAGLELVLGGEVVRRVEAPASGAELEMTLEINQSSWLALRARGEKLGETELDLRAFFSGMLRLERSSNEELLRSLAEGPRPRPSAAHTGAVLVRVAGSVPLAEQPRGRQVATLWLERLDELEARMAEDQMKAWARFPGSGDGIDLRTARANRSELLDAITAARRHHAGPHPSSAE